MLLFYFVNQDGFGAGFSEGVEQDSCWDCYEEKHIQEYKQDKEPIDP